MSLKRFDQLVDELRSCLAGLCDKRTGTNTQYTMQTIGLSAFSVFFSQCPSFLAHQKAMQHNKGQSNAQTLFQIEDTPTPNHVRDMLDPVEPKAIFPVYDRVYKALEDQGILDTFRSVHNTRPIALDGTWYFSSDKIHCDNCSRITHNNGQITYYHSAITPVIVGPDQPYAIPLRPEFIIPQDGSTKQDCEINAGKRWLDNNAAFYNTGNDTLLGDDLYAHQPFCRRTLRNNYHFIFVCKPESHKYLYQWVHLLEPDKHIHTLKVRVNNKSKGEHQHLPLRQCRAPGGRRRGAESELVRSDHYLKRQTDLPQRVHHRLHDYRAQRCRHRRGRACPLENRERKQQYAQDQGLPLGAQLRTRQKASLIAAGGPEHPGLPVSRLPDFLR